MPCKFISSFLFGLLGTGLLLSQIAHAQSCDDSALSAAVPPAAGAPRSDVMVLVNDNSPASCEVALAYANARGLGRFNLLHVRTPTNYWIDWKQFRLLRDQIIRGMQQKLLQSNPSVTLASCAGTDINPDPNAAPYAPPYYYCAASIQQLNQTLGVRYLVTTMGVPSQVLVNMNDNIQRDLGPGNPDNSDDFYRLPSSLDNHLRLQLGAFYPGRIITTRFTHTSRTEPTLTRIQVDQRSTDLQKGIDTGYINSTASGGVAEFRKINPVAEGRLAVGRIDGITVESAKRLIQRTKLKESFGVSGKFYQSSSPSPWINDFLPTWPLGIFDVRGTPCANVGDANFYLNNFTKTPVDCLVQYTRPIGGAGIALPSSPQPYPDNALLYEGMLDGQPAVPGSFDGILNWRRKPGPACPGTSTLLCDDPSLSSAQQASCRDQSIDAMKEINSQCVGVNGGFVGFNMQSYPMANYTVWPTGWTFLSEADSGSAPAFLRVRDNDGAHGNTHSLWLSNDIVANYTATEPICYQDAVIDNAAHTRNCITSGLNNRQVSLSSVLSPSRFPGGVLPIVATPTSTGGQARTFTVSFDFKSDFTQVTPSRPDLGVTVGLFVRRKVNSDGSNDNPRYNGAPMGFYPTSLQVTDVQGNPVTHPNSSVLQVKDRPDQWLHARLTFVVDPEHADACGAGTPCAELPCASSGCRTSYGWNGVSDRIALIFASSQQLMGAIGFTNVSVVMDGGGNELVTNGAFDQGYRQVATGDHASVFLDRLGGTAFFGSVGHYDTGGHSFDGEQDRIFRSFLRGLPLGDAVWTDSGVNGALYGDPLYSPVAVRLEASSGVKRSPEGLLVDKRLTQTVGLNIAAVNGRGQLGAPSYVVDVCKGGAQPLDFYACDQANLWNKEDTPLSGIAGQGGQENIAAQLNVSQWPEGWYTLRLRVTKAFTPATVFNDFLTIKLHSGPLDIHVDSEAATGGTGFADAPYKTLAEAYAAAGPGDSLQLRSGTYLLPTTLQGKAVTLTGAGSSQTTIDNLAISDWNTSQAPLISGVSVGQIHLQNVSRLNLYDVKTSQLDIADASVQMDSCLIAPNIGGNGNTTTGIVADAKAGQTLTLYSCTIAGFDTGIAFASQAGATLQIHNSIFDNATNLSAAGAGVSTAYTLFSTRGSDSATWAASAGSHNLRDKPRFWNAAGGNYRLWPDSPAINRGDPAAYYFNEPACSWPVLDLGFYGNTPQATCPRKGGSLEAITTLLLQ